MKYYCRRCFIYPESKLPRFDGLPHSYGRLYELSDEDLSCFECDGDDDIEEREVREWIVDTLRTYLTLAEQLGISEQEFGDLCPNCRYFSEVPEKGCNNIPSRICVGFSKKWKS